MRDKEFVCSECMMFSPVTADNTVGECRAHPPVVLMGATGPQALWPTMLSSAWCGDFSRKNYPEPKKPKAKTGEPAASGTV